MICRVRIHLPIIKSHSLSLSRITDANVILSICNSQRTPCVNLQAWCRSYCWHAHLYMRGRIFILIYMILDNCNPLLRILPKLGDPDEGSSLPTYLGTYANLIFLFFYFIYLQFSYMTIDCNCVYASTYLNILIVK